MTVTVEPIRWTHSASSARPSACVVGGGIAGVSAAVRLAAGA